MRCNCNDFIRLKQKKERLAKSRVSQAPETSLKRGRELETGGNACPNMLFRQTVSNSNDFAEIDHQHDPVTVRFKHDAKDVLFDGNLLDSAILRKTIRKSHDAVIDVDTNSGFVPDRRENTVAE